MANEHTGDLESLDEFLAKTGVSEQVLEGLHKSHQDFLEQLGYEPPPNKIVIPEHTEDTLPAPAEISPLTKTRMRSKPNRLIENLEHVDPEHLVFDPFVGESASQIPHTNKSLTRILEGESYIGAVSQNILSAAETLAVARDEMEHAQAAAQDLALGLSRTQQLCQQNLDHAQSRLRALGTTANQGPAAESRRTSLISLYSADELVAQSNIQLIKSFKAFGEFDRTISDFSAWVGSAVDQVNRSRLANQQRGRRNRRRARQFRFAFASLGLPGVTLLLDQAVTSIWAFSGSAALAFVMIGVDRVVSRRTRNRWVRSQLTSLKQSILESRGLVEQLKIRELQLNSMRSIYSLAPLSLVSPALLDDPSDVSTE